jgi:hypothetical protein
MGPIVGAALECVDLIQGDGAFGRLRQFDNEHNRKPNLDSTSVQHGYLLRKGTNQERPTDKKCTVTSSHQHGSTRLKSVVALF